MYQKIVIDALVILFVDLENDAKSWLLNNFII
jgi:hypothetical protein